MNQNEIFSPLGEIGETLDFLEIVHGFLKKYQKSSVKNSASQKIYQVDNFHIEKKGNDTFVHGSVESGEYGVGAKLKDINSGEKTYDKKTSDSENFPFYFLVWIDFKSQFAILICQKFGHRSIKPFFEKFLSDFVKECTGEESNKIHLMETSGLMPRKLVRALIEKGTIQEVKFRKSVLDSDSGTTFGIESLEDDLGLLELRLRARRNGSLKITQHLTNFLDDKDARLFEIPELRNIGLDSNKEVLIKVKYDNTERTIELADFGKIRPYFDIDKEVSKDKNNHPIPSSIHEIAVNLLSDLRKEIID